MEIDKGLPHSISFTNAKELGTICRNDESLIEIYSSAGYKTIKASGNDGAGVDEIKAEITGKICAFTGNSGVGKSTILNHIMLERIRTGI